MTIQVFSTGGGVWLAEAEIDEERYAVVSNECPECLSVYRKADEPYMPEDMQFSKNEDELDAVYKVLHRNMKQELEKQGVLYD